MSKFLRLGSLSVCATFLLVPVTCVLAVEFNKVLGLPPTQVVAGNQYLVDLGRDLFFDARLSSDASVSCSTCHSPEQGFADIKRFSLGVGRTPGLRNSPTVLNASLLSKFGWAGQERSLEGIITSALLNSSEMNSDEVTASRALLRLGATPGAHPIADAAKALSAFIGQLISGKSKVDRFLFAGDSAALNETEKRGLDLFFGRAQCSVCHTVRHERSHPFGGTTALFTDQRLHNLGTADMSQSNIPPPQTASDNVDLTAGNFRTPSLRNVGLTPPYMHDGRFDTLSQVIDFYANGGGEGMGKDRILRPLALTSRDRRALVSFLEALNGDCSNLDSLHLYCAARTVGIREQRQ
ncbi:c-type cytochrome [Sinorhizobium meliloti]|uniref:cytochrome-c peroxidase n=1 Tax=Rhizobium meliloti TaxID=382 RepID=UPI000B49B68F|nr:cytochrome c peroxidase [Sinorhizobium meliloti]ASQ02366.1 hypothetical protein CDO24_34985 [Sinorhizobium meliloti]MDW9702781.1 c-type cytochrome [Sinorhizobium meliloti]MDW9932941.1 c-type cytochrome [Sinorhizobium meliloti]MDX0098720.1 c-type cytochrome [Sinorhizobium meliloti]MDX0117371.1 c-type cytochrome [Sinorhizobium meliloti]